MCSSSSCVWDDNNNDNHSMVTQISCFACRYSGTRPKTPFPLWTPQLASVSSVGLDPGFGNYFVLPTITHWHIRDTLTCSSKLWSSFHRYTTKRETGTHTFHVEILVKKVSIIGDELVHHLANLGEILQVTLMLMTFPPSSPKLKS